VTNLITPRALFSLTYLLNLVKPQLAQFDPPTPKTPSYNQTWSKSDDPPRRYTHLNFPIWRPSRHLGFGETGNSAIRSADLENPNVEPNVKWIGQPLTEIWPFEIFPNVRSSVVGRWSVGRSSIYTSSYTDLIYSLGPFATLGA